MVWPPPGPPILYLCALTNFIQRVLYFGYVVLLNKVRRFVTEKVGVELGECDVRKGCLQVPLLFTGRQMMR